MYFGSLDMKYISPDPHDMETKKTPVSKELEAPAKYAWQEQSPLLCHIEHP